MLTWVEVRVGKGEGEGALAGARSVPRDVFQFGLEGGRRGERHSTPVGSFLPFLAAWPPFNFRLSSTA